MIWQPFPVSLRRWGQLNVLHFLKSWPPLRSTPSRNAHQGNTLPIPPHISALESPEDATEARAWLARFKKQSIPKGLVEMTFSRSSGPGGQVCNNGCSFLHLYRMHALSELKVD